MVPIEKVKDIITKYQNLEKELSSGKIESKLFAKKSKEYSSLGEIIETAKKFVNFIYCFWKIIYNKFKKNRR